MAKSAGFPRTAPARGHGGKNNRADIRGISRDRVIGANSSMASLLKSHFLHFCIDVPRQGRERERERERESARLNAALVQIREIKMAVN